MFYFFLAPFRPFSVCRRHFLPRGGATVFLRRFDEPTTGEDGQEEEESGRSNWKSAVKKVA